MAKDPAFLFYPGDFMSGTMFFSDEQVGKYIRLLCAQHLTGHLTEKHMLSICKSRDEDIFSKFSIDAQGKYFNERLEAEISRRKNYTESRRKNGKCAKNQEDIKKNKDKIDQTDDEAYAKHMGNHMETINENENITVNKGKGVQGEREPRRGGFVQPTAHQVEAYLFEHGTDTESSRLPSIAQCFCDHYQSNGWRVGRNPMRDWKAAVRNWLKRSKEFENQHKSHPNGSTPASEERVGRMAKRDLEEYLARPIPIIPIGGSRH